MLMMFLVGGIASQKLNKFQRVRKDLFGSGFVENTKKSQWDPIQEGEHSSFIVNLKDGSFSVTPSRVEKLSHF